MGVRKGTDNFSSYRATKAEGNLRLIADILAHLRKKRIPYPTVQILANEVAERTSIHRTTLLRNPEYKRLMLNFLASQPGATSAVLDEEASPELLRAKLFDARLEAKNLRKRIVGLEQQILLAGCGGQSSANTGQPGMYAAFNNTVVVLKLVLERINSGFEVMRVDLDAGEILDLAAPKGRQLVASAGRTKAFVEVYRVLLEQEGNLKGGSK